jgi:hypothetical protein
MQTQGPGKVSIAAALFVIRLLVATYQPSVQDKVKTLGGKIFIGFLAMIFLAAASAAEAQQSKKNSSDRGSILPPWTSANA